jgi:hypothetical protein
LSHGEQDGAGHRKSLWAEADLAEAHICASETPDNGAGETPPLRPMVHATPWTPGATVFTPWMAPLTQRITLPEAMPQYIV